jgi:hypothetical protein
VFEKKNVTSKNKMVFTFKKKGEKREVSLE